MDDSCTYLSVWPSLGATSNLWEIGKLGKFAGVDATLAVDVDIIDMDSTLRSVKALLAALKVKCSNSKMKRQALLSDWGLAEVIESVETYNPYWQ